MRLGLRLGLGLAGHGAVVGNMDSLRGMERNLVVEMLDTHL